MAPERGKAFGIYAGIAGTGGAIARCSAGRRPSARLALVPVRVAPLRDPGGDAGTRLLHHVPAPARPRLDLPGTPTASSGLFALVFGLARGESGGWGDLVTVGALIGGAVLLAFVALERRVAHPLLPLGVVVDRKRGAAFPAIGTASAGLFGLLLFLTCYVQNTKDLTALETGLPFPRLIFSIAPTVGIVRACCPAPGRAGSSPPTLRRPR
jgi:hypothetical protein